MELHTFSLIHSWCCHSTQNLIFRLLLKLGILLLGFDYTKTQFKLVCKHNNNTL